VSNIKVNGEIGIEEAGRVLSEALGDRYKVITGGGAAEIVVRRYPLISAPVRMSWTDGTTNFEVHGTGFVGLRIANSFGIVRTVDHALRQGFRDRIAA